MITQLSGLVQDRAMRRRYALALGMAMLSRTLTVMVLFPLLTRLFSDEPTEALPWLGALGVAVILGWITDRRLALVGFDIGFAMLISIERRVLDRVSRMPVGWLDASRRGAVQKALTTAGHELCTGVAYLLTPALSALGSTVLIGVCLFVVSPWLALVALGSIGVFGLAHVISGRLLRSAEHTYAQASGETGQRIVELARSQRVLRAAGRSSTSTGPIRKALDEHRRAARGLTAATVPGQLMFGVAAQLVLLALAGAVAALAVRGDLMPAAAVACIIVLVRFHEAFTTFADLGPAMEGLRGGLDRVDAVLSATPLPEPESSARPVEGAMGIELDRVTFRHDPQSPVVLDDVSLSVPVGSTAAIVGPSGSGKSTLLGVLARIGDVEAGRALVRGHDVRDYDLDTLMAQLGIVSQDVYLFDGTLRDNVTLARPEASADEVAAAAFAAQLDEVVGRLPDGWDTRVGEGGDLLSGGEKQRVSVARALLKAAPVLLLDEASSALDTHNERALVSALRNGSADRTTVVVAHRLETIAHADQILFLEGGRIIERGTLEELVAQDGRFATYWRARRGSAAWTLAN